MGNALKGITDSKKFMGAIIASIIAAVCVARFELPLKETLVIIAPIMTAIGAQGFADIGKEKAKIENGGKS
jgi:hypothetical protein